MQFFRKKHNPIKSNNNKLLNEILINALNNIFEVENIGYLIKYKNYNDFIINSIATKILSIENPQNIQRPEIALKNLNEVTLNQILETIENQETNTKTFVGKISNKENKDIKITVVKKINHYIDFIITIVDITHQEKDKRELFKKIEKLEEANKLKNIFLANISREIRTPLNSIIGFTELLNLLTLSNQEKENYLKIIKNQSNYLLQIFDDISEIALFESGEIKPKNSPCNLNLLLKELFTFFTQQKKFLNKENIDIRLYLPDNKGINTFTDSGRLHQLLSNLIYNSLKHTEKGLIEFGYNIIENNKILFFVKDTGKPFSKEELKNLFEKSKGKEIALIKNEDERIDTGLTIAKYIVNLLKGKIWAESEENFGNAFYFTIPFIEIPKSNLIDNKTFEIDFKEQILHILKDKNVLIVEDDDVSFIFLESLLLDKNARVIRANNGIEAIELVNKLSKIDLILMDIRLPQLDGIEASKSIKKSFPDIKILAQTAYAVPDDLSVYSKEFFDDIITKPINITELFKKIINLLH